MRLIALQLLYAIALSHGAVLAQQISPPATPANVEIVSHKWSMLITRSNPAAPVPNSQTVERSEEKPLGPIDPTPKVVSAPEKRQVYIYSAEVLNRGQKDISGVSWEYAFTDPVTNATLKRQTGVSLVKIRTNQKKALQIRSASSPPKVINASTDRGAFAERVTIHCILFADGSLWQNPDLKVVVCGKLGMLSNGHQ